MSLQALCVQAPFMTSLKKIYEEDISPNTSLAFYSFRLNHYCHLLLRSSFSFRK